MLHFVQRTCSTRENDFSNNVPAPISDFRELDAYVLLGDPGSGKSRLFKEEANNTENGYYVIARDFIDYDRDEWRGKTLFIDGLDETRAGRSDAHTPLGAIRGKLDRLGRPRFRLSCRAADWLGNNDAEALTSCTPNEKITVLYLEPLSHAQVIEILEHDLTRVPDATDFLNKASRYSLEGLLYNPQTLDMLISAVDGGQWPTTKLAVYEQSCKKLAVEHNDKAHQQSFTNIQLLDAAGWLSAILLLANASGVYTGSNADSLAEESLIFLNDLDIPEAPACRAALKMRLFTYVKDDEYAYVHRSVAEYLGARFIVEKIKQGLPFGRILALVTGFDGGVVASLRGLMAWLGALNPQARDHLIEIDPLGVVLYGDAQLFSVETKLQLLEALKREAKKTSYLNYNWSTHAFAALVTEDMLPHLKALLTSPSRDKTEQNILGCILDGLYRSQAVSGLDEVLISVIRDRTYWEGVRVGALQAYMHQYPDNTDSLLSLAEDIRLNKTEDSGLRLLGMLLDKLFPKHIPASQIFQYLQQDKDTHSISRYEIFWDTVLPERLSDEDLSAALDAIGRFKIAARGREAIDRHVCNMAGQLLVKGIQLYGQDIADERLYNWLSIGMDEYDHSHLNKECQQQIRDWVSTRPDRYLALLGIGIRDISDPEKVHYQIYKVTKRLYQALRPVSLGSWWLEQALNVTEPKLQDEYFCQAFWMLLQENEGNQGLSLEAFEQFIDQHPNFAPIYQKITQCPIENEDWRQDHVKQEKKWGKERDDELKARLDYFNQHKAAIADGSAYPQVLHHLAAAYFDHYTGKTGEERLSDFLNGDEELIAAAKSGLRKVLDRTDLPEIAEIFALTVKQREHLIRLPFLTCMEKLYQETPTMLDTLSDNLASKALAFWHTYGAGNEPAWVKLLSLMRPTLAASVLIEYVNAMLAGKVQHITGLYQLTHDKDYQEIASMVAIPLLKTYPIRGSKQQASSLEYLLKAAISSVDKSNLLALVEKKLSLKGLDVIQRVYWLATGLMIAPQTYAPMVRVEVGGNTVRINHLSAFLYSGRHDQHDNDLPANSIGLLVELLAPRCTPERETGAHIITQAMNERDYVSTLLNKLANMPDETSALVLDHLLALPQLSAWHEQIRAARQTQQISRRETLFQHPDTNEVVQTLRNLKPSNVEDLAAMTMNFLEKLAGEVHGGNTDSYKHFWNVDGYNRPTEPRPENGCRDYLAERLKVLFAPFDVDVWTETREANSKRADIELSFRSNGRAFRLPIEFKLDHSLDLWRTIHEQLIPLYTIAPETEGRGILLVIWFNDPNKRSSAPPSGTKPKTADELAERLRESLSLQEQNLIKVFVLDISK